MKLGHEFTSQPFEITYEQYQAADPFRATQPTLYIKQELLLLKKLPPIEREIPISHDLVRILRLQDLEDGKKSVTFTKVDPRGDEHNSPPDTLTLSYRSYVEELPEGPEKVEDWQDYPITPRPVGFLLPPEFFANNT